MRNSRWVRLLAYVTGYVIYFKEEDHQRAAQALGAVTVPGVVPE